MSANSVECEQLAHTYRLDITSNDIKCKLMWRVDLSICAWRPVKGTFANSVDPDQTPQSRSTMFALNTVISISKTL